MKDLNMLTACGFFFLGHVGAWFHLNSQFVWEWWKDKPLITTLIFSLPVGLSFYFGTKYAVTGTDSLWSSRLMSFGISYFIFPVLTYIFFKESMFETKTLICVFLSFTIIAVQVFWK